MRAVQRSRSPRRAKRSSQRGDALAMKPAKHLNLSFPGGPCARCARATRAGAKRKTMSSVDTRQRSSMCGVDGIDSQPHLAPPLQCLLAPAFRLTAMPFTFRGLPHFYTVYNKPQMYVGLGLARCSRPARLTHLHSSPHRQFRETTPPRWYEISYISNIDLTLDNVLLDPNVPLFGGPVSVTRLSIRDGPPVELNAAMMQFAFGSVSELYVSLRVSPLPQFSLFQPPTHPFLAPGPLPSPAGSLTPCKCTLRQAPSPTRL